MLLVPLILIKNVSEIKTGQGNRTCFSGLFAVNHEKCERLVDTPSKYGRIPTELPRMKPLSDSVPKNCNDITFVFDFSY